MTLSDLIVKAVDHGITIRFQPLIGMHAVSMRVSDEDQHIERCISRRQIKDSKIDMLSMELDRCISILERPEPDWDQNEAMCRGGEDEPT